MSYYVQISSHEAPPDRNGVLLRVAILFLLISQTSKILVPLPNFIYCLTKNLSLFSYFLKWQCCCHVA